MKILGYVWSYKESQKTSDNTFSIAFKHGFSEEYPKYFENKKDFDCFVVKEGDYSPLYMELEEAKIVFDSEISGLVDDYYKECWKDDFSDDMSWDDWQWCWAMAGVEFEATLSRKIIKEGVYTELGMDDRREEVLKKYYALCEDVYNKELDELSI